MSYAGTLFYSWAADISISSENAASMHHELQNGDPTEHLDTRRCGQRYAIRLGIKKEPINIPRHLGRVRCRCSIRPEERRYYLLFADDGISVMAEDGSDPPST